MAKLRDNLFNGGGNSDGVWVAPKGTTFPTDLSAPVDPFKEIGWLGDDGLEFESNIDRKEFKAHQGGVTIKRKVTGSGRTFTFVALETNPVVLSLVEPGTAWTKAGTGAAAVATGVAQESIQTVELAWIVDSYDESYTPARRIRKLCTGEASQTGSFKFGVEDITAYTFEVAVYGAPITITNQPSIIANIT